MAPLAAWPQEEQGHDLISGRSIKTSAVPCLHPTCSGSEALWRLHPTRDRLGKGEPNRTAASSKTAGGRREARRRRAALPCERHNSTYHDGFCLFPCITRCKAAAFRHHEAAGVFQVRGCRRGGRVRAGACGLPRAAMRNRENGLCHLRVVEAARDGWPASDRSCAAGAGQAKGPAGPPPPAESKHALFLGPPRSGQLPDPDGAAERACGGAARRGRRNAPAAACLLQRSPLS